MPDLFLDQKLKLKASIEELFWQKVKRIDTFKFDWNNAGINKPAKELRELKELSTIQSIGSSTRIEGSTLTDDDVEELIKNLEINKLKNRDEEEVAGYYEALELIHNEYKSLEISEGYIKQLHHLLLKYSSKDTRHRGGYKSLSNKVVAKYPGGIEKVIFNTTEPYLVDQEMSELVKWTNEKLEDTNYHPLLIIAIFTYEFLSIHPFQDGNGRLSRILSNLLLMKKGYPFIEYISFEHIIEERKKDYYQVLMSGQKDRYSKKEDLSLWIIYFVECLETLCERLKIKIESSGKYTEKRISPNNTGDEIINDRQEKILVFIEKNNSARMSNLLKAIPDVPRPTLSLDLADLVEKELLTKHGQGRGTFYRLKA